MKTIFLTIFEGVEAKNLLRTPVLSTLLSDPDIRIVLLTKSSERTAYYQKEFQNPQLVYEVIPRVASSRADRFFARLKFQLLCTATTDLRREMMYRDGGSAIGYYGGLLVNRLIAHAPIRRLVRMLDFLLVRDETYRTYFDRYRPDCVVMAHLFDEQEIHLLREAKRRGVPTIGFINSWDKVTARCIMRLLPDKAIVFNYIVKDELMKHNEMRAEDIFVSGIPQYDQFIHPHVRPREEFFKTIGVDPSKKLIVYAPIGSAFSTSDWDMIDRMHELNREGTLGPNVAMLVRFQPNDFFKEEEFQKRPWLVYTYPGTRFSDSQAVVANNRVDWDMNAHDLQYLTDTLAHASLVVCYASSIGIDAALMGKPVINLNFEVHASARAQKSPTQFYKMEHYKKALQTGGLRLVNSETELIEWVNTYLRDPSRDADKRAELIRQQCVYTDGKSGERIGRFVLQATTIKSTN